jgi:hypothetical protein
VFQLRLHWERVKSHWKHSIFLLGLAAALAAVTSCGSNNSTVAPTITVSCTPTDVTVLTTSQCTASVQNLSSTLVNWSVSGSGTGTITSGGLYTGPSSVPTNNVVTITATSQVQSSVTATENLTIEAATAIAALTCIDPNTNTTPSPLIVASNQQLACTATDSTGTSVSVNWTVTNANKLGGNVGAISSQGIYTAPFVPPPGQAVTITATSQSVSTITSSVTATIVFGSSVLSGNYVFSTTGQFPLPSGAFWARAGSFSAGGGVINGGLEDTNQGGSPNVVTQGRTFSGSYSVGPDGRGTMQFCESASAGSPAPPSCPFGSSNATAFFRVAVISPQQAQIIEFSSPTSSAAAVTAGGDIVAQDPSVFQARNAILSGTYSFNFAGASNTATEESVVGEFLSNGFGTISPGNTGSPTPPASPGEIDIDAAGPVILPGSSYAVSASGRGTVTLNGLMFSFYPISAGRARFIEIDQPSSGTTPDSILVGDAYKQQTSSTCQWGASNALSGSTVLETFGSASGGFAVADVGAFTATNGAVSGVSMDQNSAGTYTQPSGTPGDNYAMDPCGRGTLSVAGHSYVFYVISPSSAVLQETTSGTVAHGLLLPAQTGSFANGSYAFQFEGTDAAGTGGQQEDFLGQFTSATPSGSGTTLNGTLDLNDATVTQTGLPITNGAYSSGGVRSTATFPIGNPVSATRNLVLYMVSPTLFYALDIDTTGTAIGLIGNQF